MFEPKRSEPELSCIEFKGKIGTGGHMKEHQKRDILIISSVLVVVLMAVLLLNRDKPFSIFSSGDQVKQVTNAYLQQTNQLEPDFTPNPNEAITLSTDSTLAVVYQPTSTQQNSELEIATYLPSETQALAASATGTSPASIVATNTRPPAATSTKASTSTQPTQSVSTSYPVPTSQTASTNTPVPTNTAIATNAPTGTFTATATATATRTATATATATATQTLAPTLQTGWEGEWVIYLQQDNETYISGTMNLALNGTEVIASAKLDGVEYNFEGINHADGEQISGPWQSDSSSGYFWWLLVSENQFGGSQDLQYGFCGARVGFEMPDPCFIEPPR